VPYNGIFGGVTAFKQQHFELVNGFSNQFYGWGGEDDDMYNRLVWHIAYVALCKLFRFVLR